MTSLASYTEMKDSGIHWMGIIPKHWDIQKAKFHFTQTNTRGNGTPILLAASQKYGVCPQSWLEGVVQISENTDLQQFKTVHKNDFVISLRSFQGGFERSDFEGVCSPAYQVFHADDLFNNDYLKYLFKNELFIDEMNSLTVGIREGRNIKYDDFANSLIFIPPLNEQSTIAAYLDNQCAKIDEIIAEVQAGIEDYKQWKAAIIYEAVTKGLDPNVEMKDSGVEWIGKIPSNWTTKSTKYIMQESKERTATGTEEMLSVTQKYGIIKSSDATISNPSTSTEDWRIVHIGDIVFNKYKAHSGVFFVSPLEGIVTFNYCVYRCFPDNCAKYFEYQFKTPRCIGEFITHMKGVGDSISPLYTTELYKIKVIVPPIEEQLRIVEYLNIQCPKIDEIISEKESLVADLESYKKSLIFEVVTGKRRVV